MNFMATMDRVWKRQRSGRVEGFFRRLDALEIPFTRRVACGCAAMRLQGAGVIVNRLANGWLYLAIGAALVAHQSWRPLMAALVSVAFAFLFYLPVKASLARTRPCELDPELPCPTRALDRFSCPSGHCMTVVAVGVPVGFTYPELLPAIVVALLLVAWARLALGHHYVSDLIVGAVLGCSVSMPVSVFLLD